MIEQLGNKLGICYLDNRNIRRKHLWKDTLHLHGSGKVILTNHLFVFLFLIRIYHPGVIT